MILQFIQMDFDMLPTEIQQEICNKINGLENVKIIRPGYAIEYDFIDPRELFNLETKKIRNLSSWTNQWHNRLRGGCRSRFDRRC